MGIVAGIKFVLASLPETGGWGFDGTGIGTKVGLGLAAGANCGYTGLLMITGTFG